MDDPELQAIREARLKQLRQNASSQGSSLPQDLGVPGGSGDNDPEAAAQRAAEDQMRRDQLAMLLEPAARERRVYL